MIIGHHLVTFLTLLYPNFGHLLGRGNEKSNMPFMYFKKNIGLNLNSF